MKFLKKKPVKIGLIVASVLMLALITAFCARPVSVGYSYTGKISNFGEELDVKYHFNSFDKVTAVAKGGITIEQKGWFFTNDGYLIVAGEVDSMTKDEFKEQKKSALDNWDTYSKMLEEYGMKINAFTITIDDETLVCGGAIATVIVLAVVELGLVALTVMSFVSKKKK